MTKNYPNVTQSFGIAGIVILGMLFLNPVNIVLEKLIGKEASMFIYYLLAIGLPFLIVYTIRKRKTREDSFNLNIENKLIIPFVVAGTIALLFGIISPIGSLIPMPENIQKVFMDFGSQTGFFPFLLMVVAAPILEELIFRGIILDGLLKNYSPEKSILLSSFLFGLVHLNPWQFVTGFIIGLFAGWVYYKTQSLSLTIIIHATANLSGYIMRYFIDMDSSMDDSLVRMYGGLTNLIFVILGSIIIASACIYFLGKEFSKTKVEMAAQNKSYI
ncbi:CPBP family intramembrane glutamic endopeptidase [Maribellus maritimus]|uniref:CPBP family intramembrane glutamic endopeptidase n=1 Tax=Maribellus maritimus TaxID=2870838 RepID=UPI001EEB6FC6|nr:type II CAAX endopeptidase family protein [Maribellus maritimus]MCG6189007.1 CPBP family intramembrane metalloprotease [Maribellus maritimus]